MGDALCGGLQQRTNQKAYDYRICELLGLNTYLHLVRCFETHEFYIWERMAAHRHPLRDRILGRIERGELASVREIMLVASIPRQTANRWLREAGIRLDVARLRMLTKMHEREERYLAGLPARRKPSKKFLRKVAQRAKRQWDERHAEPQGIPPHSR